MPQDYYSLVTNIGLIKEAEAGQIGANPINLTEIAVGDGNGSYYEPDSAATSLVNELYRTNLTSAVLDANNPNQLIIEGVIPEEAGPFYIREVGIFDSDGDLFAIGKYPETFKSNYESGSGKRLYIRLIVAFVSIPNVQIILSENINFDPNFEANLNIELAGRLKISENLADLNDVNAAKANLGIGSASEEVEGLAEFATQTEADDDTNDDKVLTPLKASFLKRPTFRVSKTSAQSFGATTETKITYNIVEYDNKSWYDAVNHRYTPQKAGFYLFSATVAFRDISDAARVEARMRFNGNTVAFQTVSGRANVAQTLIANVSTILFLNGTTDYVDIAGYSTNSGNIEAAASIFNNFSGCYLGG